MASLRYFAGIRYGSFKDLEVLVDPEENSLWITQPTVARLLGWDNNRAPEKLKAKGLKTFAGKGLTVTKKIKAKDSIGRNQEVNALPFDTFLTVVYWQLSEGNDKAKALLMAGFADSFSSLVLEQCGVKLTKDQRQNVVSFYLQGYHKFYDWVRDTYRAVYGKDAPSEYYRDLTVTINEYLFSKSHFYRDRKKNANDSELRRLENFQMLFMESKVSNKQADPLALLEEYINKVSEL